MRSKVFNSISLVAALSIGVLSVGCGGGGDTTTVAPPVATSTVSLSGVVTVATSSTGGLSAAAVTSSTTNSLIEGAVIKITSYDKAGKSLGETVVSSSDKGNFGANVPLSTTGGYVVMTSHKDGFVDFSRRVDYDTPDNINLMVEMDAANTVAIPVGSTSTTIGSSSIIKKANGKEYVLFAFFKDASGRGKMMVGKAALSRMAAGDKPSVSLEIPKASIPSDVTTLVGSINSYDPTNSEDAKKFPGSYADSKGNRLVSLGFDFIDIKTDGGQTLGAAIKKAVAKGSLKKSAADEPYYVTRWMNKSNCATLKMGDSDNNSSTGFNIPIYTYSYVSGNWDLLGNGQIVDNSGVAKTYSNANAITQCETNSGDYVKIAVTNKDYLNTPWNLDYPILTTAPKEVCVQGKLVDQDGKDIKQNVYLSFYDNDSAPNSFNWKSVSSKNDGTYKLSTILVDSEDSDRVGTLQYSNPYTYENETLDVTMGVSPSCTTKNITITRPQMCTVTGQIKDDTGAIKANEPFYLYASSPYMYRYATTGSDGNFTMETRCSLEQHFYGRNNDLATFNPNGTKDLNENSDEGSVVNLGVLTIANQAPYANGWLNNGSIKVGATASIGIYGYDYDGDAPLTWTLYDGTTVLETNTTTGNYLYQNVEKTFSSTGDHVIKLKVTDSKSKSTEYTIGTLTVDVSGNRAPKITSYVSDQTVVGTNKSNTLYARGYDLDGDNISWNYKKGSTTLCNGTATGGSFDTSCTYTTGASDANEIITFTVTDSEKSTAKDLTIFVQDTAPIIASAIASKYRPEMGETITLTAQMYDIDGDAMSVKLYANGVEVTGCALNNNTGKGTAAAPLTGTCSYTMATTPSVVTFRLDVFDGSKTRSTTFNVSAGTTAGLEIKIQ